MKDVTRKAAWLADLIVHAEPARIIFKSEEQFLSILGAGPAKAHSRVGDPKRPSSLSAQA